MASFRRRNASAAALSRNRIDSGLAIRRFILRRSRRCPRLAMLRAKAHAVPCRSELQTRRFFGGCLWERRDRKTIRRLVQCDFDFADRTAVHDAETRRIFVGAVGNACPTGGT